MVRRGVVVVGDCFSDAGPGVGGPAATSKQLSIMVLLWVAGGRTHASETDRPHHW